MRIAGAAAGDDHVVVAQTLDSVSQAQSTLILAELLIGPILLLVVFVGAVAIGRRVAAPIERASRRQLEFTADASHELRTPLSVIEAHTSLALAQERSESWYRGAFERVDLESKRMRRLLDDLLWLARFDATEHARPMSSRSTSACSPPRRSTGSGSSPRRATCISTSGCRPTAWSSTPRPSGSTGCSASSSTTPASTRPRAAR